MEANNETRPELLAQILRQALEQADLALALVDTGGKSKLSNREYRRLGALLGSAEPAQLILDAVRSEEGGGIGPPVDGAAAFSDREVRIDGAGGPSARWYVCSATWVRDEEESFGLLLFAKDVTRQRAEQEKARMAALQAVLAEEGRIDGLRETLSAAVFQLEGTINVMGSVMSTISRRGCCAPAGDALTEALEAGRAAVATLRQSIPERSAETPTAVNLNEVLQDVLELSTKRLLACGIGVAWKPQPVLPNLPGYPNRLRAMLKALVDNAIDAMDSRGWRQRELRIATRSLPGALEVAIEDSGPGIAEELRLKVFEPFFTTRRGGGRHLGTGLSSALQVAMDHGGSIELDPVEGGGCRARVVLPLKNTAGEPA